MTNTFTASNGVEVGIDSAGIWTMNAAKDQGYLNVTPGELAAIREFFQHERDEELGRWRWPENRDYVVYARADHVQVVSEASGNAMSFTREQTGLNIGLSRAANAYFEAHPESKPWEDAKPGEVWVLSVEGVESFAVHATAGFLGEVVFKTITGTNVNMRSSAFSSARKIWPVEES